MQLRRVSPVGEVRLDAVWTRWEKWGKAAITVPTPADITEYPAAVTTAPSIRRRADGLIYNGRTDEYFQADADALLLFETLATRPARVADLRCQGIDTARVVELALAAGLLRAA